MELTFILAVCFVAIATPINSMKICIITEELIMNTDLISVQDELQLILDEYALQLRNNHNHVLNSIYSDLYSLLDFIEELLEDE